VRLRADSGSGSILGLAVMGSICGVVAIALPLYIGLAAQQAVSGAADAAALGAADVASGIAPGSPCAVAARITAANGGVLAACRVDGLVVTVRVRREFLGLHLTSDATAGPPDAATD
jgi:secretion/DNA translocation related TadE-like protein